MECRYASAIFPASGRNRARFPVSGPIPGTVIPVCESGIGYVGKTRQVFLPGTSPNPSSTAAPMAFKLPPVLGEHSPQSWGSDPPSLGGVLLCILGGTLLFFFIGGGREGSRGVRGGQGRSGQGRSGKVSIGYGR